jgi:hypothetical protein
MENENCWLCEFPHKVTIWYTFSVTEGQEINNWFFVFSVILNVENVTVWEQTPMVTQCMIMVCHIKSGEE